MTTVVGRVRATVRLKSGGGDVPRVLETSWAADRPFPRTRGVAVPFELEASDGQIYRVEPFEALVALPVRAVEARDGVRHEEAWIAAHDELTIEGELEHPARARLPVLHARRIVMAGAATPHRLPPRALQRGESEKVDEVDEVVVAAPAVVVAPGAPPPAVALGDGVPEPTSAADSSATESGTAGSGTTTLPPRRPKKKRPDSSGTPPPVQSD